MIDRREDGDLAIARMVRGKGNSLSVEFLEAITAEFKAIERSPARAVVFTGQEKVFCAGVDLFRVLDGGEEYLKKFLPALTDCIMTMLRFPKPIVAAINGHAIAGGCILAMCSDLRFMACGPAKIGLTELLVGVPFPSLIMEIVRFSLAPRVFREAVYTGRLYGAEDAAQYGIVEQIIEPDELLGKAQEAARQLAAVPSETFRLTKQQLLQPVMEQFERHGPAMDERIHRYWAEPETLAGIRRFVDATVKSR